MTTAWYGPAAWEGPAPRRYGPVGRVAVVSDVHVNVAALPSPSEITAETERLVFSD